MSTPLRRILCTLTVLAAAVGYLAYVFRLFDHYPRDYGLGDWQDPYFINALLEHWYRSTTRFSSPASPPMYFPVEKTLGYSHGLVLFAPFYVVVRPFLHPFHAHTAGLFGVILGGAFCLYALLRALGLSFAQSFSLTALFVSSRNVIHGETGVWSQRASVFLVPGIVLLFVSSARMPRGAARLALAGVAGLLASLMYVQDFYSAHFSVLFAAVFGLAYALVDGAVPARVTSFARVQPAATKLALLAIAVLAAWACFVFFSGGVDVRVFGAHLRSHDWRRPGLAAVAGTLAFVWWQFRGAVLQVPRRHGWLTAVILGAAAGAAVFLWIYLPKYREHPAFPREQLQAALLPRDITGWPGTIDAFRDLSGYNSMRSFLLVFVTAALAWLPGLRTDRRTRLYALWMIAASLVVLLIPFRFGAFSLWQAVLQPLPGFGVIRDPKRIIQLYELAVVVGIALLLRRAGSWLRMGTIASVLVLLIAFPNPERFDYERRIDLFDRWIAAPITVAPGCRSFYMKPASADYMSRSPQMWSLYGVDATFLALDLRIPTVNGYSAWFPEGWGLHDPQIAGYRERVQAWIDGNRLSGVCALDVDARTLTPHVPDARPTH